MVYIPVSAFQDCTLAAVASNAANPAMALATYIISLRSQSPGMNVNIPLEHVPRAGQMPDQFDLVFSLPGCPTEMLTVTKDSLMDAKTILGRFMARPSVMTGRVPSAQTPIHQLLSILKPDDIAHVRIVSVNLIHNGQGMPRQVWSAVLELTQQVPSMYVPTLQPFQGRTFTS